MRPKRAREGERERERERERESEREREREREAGRTLFSLGADRADRPRFGESDAFNLRPRRRKSYVIRDLGRLAIFSLSRFAFPA